MIKGKLELRIKGTQDDVLEGIRLLKPFFQVKICSRFIENTDELGVHCFIVLFPKETGVEPIAVEETQTRV